MVKIPADREVIKTFLSRCTHRGRRNRVKRKRKLRMSKRVFGFNSHLQSYQINADQRRHIFSFSLTNCNIIKMKMIFIRHFHLLSYRFQVPFRRMVTPSLLTCTRATSPTEVHSKLIHSSLCSNKTSLSSQSPIG